MSGTASARDNHVNAAKAAKETVLLVPIDLRDRAAVVVTGKDRTSWLNGLVTCDLAKLAPGEAAYGLLVEKKGRIQTDFFIVEAAYIGGDAFALAVPSKLREETLSTLDHYLIMENAELSSPDLAFFAMHGPRAAEVARAAGARWTGTLDLLGEGGAIVAVPAQERAGFESRLGSLVRDAGGAIADDATWNALRIERGLPRFGHEFDNTYYPQEASLEKLAVSFDKGCYLGQEVVYMLENRGHVKKKLVPLDIEGEATLDAGALVSTPDGAEVGDVKSSALGPFGGHAVAIAAVKWAQCKPGTELRVGGRVARVRAFP